MRCLSLTRFVLSLAAALLAVGVCAPRAQASFILNKPSALGLNNGLVGWWTFDEPNMDQNYAHDASGNGNRGLLNTTSGTQTFSTSASTTYTVPQGVRFITVETWGAGGEGGVGLSGSDGGGGGGGGGYAKKVINVNPGEILDLSIGAGGSGSTDVKGKPGGDSYVADASSILVRACGGGGGGASVDNGNNGGLAGAGGTIACGTGDVEFAGGDGGPGENGTDGDGAGGGEGACDNGNGAVGGTPGTNGGAGGSGGCTGTGGGNGGGGGNNGASGTNGTAVGGGGGGAGEGTTLSGGDGAAGQITITYDAPDPQRVPGKIGQALQFDGADDYVDTLSTNGMDNLSKFTYSVWIKPSIPTSGVSRSIISKNGSDKYFSFYGDCCGNNKLRGLVQTSGTRADTTLANNTIMPGNWYHVVMTYDDSTDRKIYMYVNGSLATPTQIAATGTITTEAGTSYQFARASGGDSAFPGLLDDIRIYNRALSADEIKRLYNLGGTVKLNTSRSTGSLATGLVGWWTFDGKDVSGVQTYDKSGNGNRGTLTNGPRVAMGKLGQGLSFDGSNDFVSLPAISTTQYSVTAGVKSNVPGFGNLDVQSQDSDVTSLKFSESNIVSNNPLFYVQNSLGSFFTAYDSSVLKAGTWYFLVGTFDGSAVRFYLNGAEGSNSPTNFTGTIHSSSNVRFIGVNYLQSGAFFNGTIDDVRLYNRALSADEIKRLYNLGGTVKLNTTLEGPKNGLVGWWTFDGKEMAGNYAMDKSGNGNRGTLTGTNGVPVRTLGKIGQGTEFDGSDDYVDVADSSALQVTTQLTMSAWIKFNRTGVRYHPISKDSNESATDGWTMERENTN